MTELKADSVAPQENSVQSETKPESKADKVAYETYSRVLSEAKKLKEKLKSYEDEKLKEQEAKLVDEKQYKTLAENYKVQLDHEKQAKAELLDQVTNGIKYDAFRRNLPGELVSDDFIDKLPLDKIIIDPDTKKINEESATMAANEFYKKHPYLVKTQQAKMPNAAAKGADFNNNFNGLKSKDDIKNALAAVLGKQ
jgi:hypothetical protein